MRKLEPAIKKSQPPTSSDPAELLQKLADLVPLGQEVINAHMLVTTAPTVGNALLLTILERDSTSTTP